MIDPDEQIRADDFINESEQDPTPSNDEGRVPKLESDGRLSKVFVPEDIKFGGDGSDGALSISSGTTTVNLAGERVVYLNYTSISITGTGKLAFSNPHANGTVVVIRCQGDCVLTSSSAPMIDLEGIGADAGAGGSRSTGPANTVGGSGTDGQTYGFIKTNKADQAINEQGGAVSSAVAGMTIFGGGIQSLEYSQIVARYPRMFVGAGGGGGRATVTSGTGLTTAGNGGRGGGCLIMEIAGAINFTTTNGISVAGKDGQHGQLAGTSYSGAGGGGGGGGGSAFIFYNAVTAFTGTVKVSGGVGGNLLKGASGDSNGGGGGGSLLNAGQNGSNSSVNGAKCGGDGGAGLEVHGLNTFHYSLV